MSEFTRYAEKYQCIKIERRGGILQMTLHTDGDSLRWSSLAHSELPNAFKDVGDDPANKVVILTGCGTDFSGPRVTSEQPQLFKDGYQPESANRIIRDGKALLMNFLNIDVPVIGAVNGPAWRHAELPLLADIVLASETACFQDSAHFSGGLVPGDGMHIVLPLLLGLNRGRYFLLTGEVLNAKSSYALGLVAEVLPAEQLVERAWDLARQIEKRPASLVRHTRAVLTEELKRRIQDLLGFGLYAEMMALAAPDNRPSST